jgi:hypothetical protein
MPLLPFDFEMRSSSWTEEPVLPAAQEELLTEEQAAELRSGLLRKTWSLNLSLTWQGDPALLRRVAWLGLILNPIGLLRWRLRWVRERAAQAGLTWEPATPLEYLAGPPQAASGVLPTWAITGVAASAPEVAVVFVAAQAGALTPAQALLGLFLALMSWLLFTAGCWYDVRQACLRSNRERLLESLRADMEALRADSAEYERDRALLAQGFKLLERRRR